MFETKPKFSPLVKKMIDAQGKPEMDNPQIRVGQGDKNNSLTFFYRPNSPDYKAESK